ncbi:hypothetical protein B0H13DRAFT_1903516 [Mycena leptocephala]|nr:hypothetical protein B0H13DRAFT_1903516 [Mycena leptocephala]
MASLGTTQIAVTIALTVVEAHFVQQVVHSQVLNEHELSNDSVLQTIWSVIFFINKKVVIVPALLMLSTFVMGIVGATAFGGAVNDVTRQIIVSLATATNLVLTALTGKLESGAIYCITAIFLVITVSLYDPEIYNTGIGVAQQLINIIPTFTLVYVGLNNTDYSQPKEHIGQVPSTSRSAVVQPCQPWEVLDIKPQLTEEKDGEWASRIKYEATEATPFNLWLNLCDKTWGSEGRLEL